MTRSPLVDVLLTFGVFASVAGCMERPAAAHTVDYYRAHADERRVRVRDCVNDPGTEGRSPDCINALEADRLEGIGSFRELAPMQLPDTNRPQQP